MGTRCPSRREGGDLMELTVSVAVQVPSLGKWLARQCQMSVVQTFGRCGGVAFTRVPSLRENPNAWAWECVWMGLDVGICCFLDPLPTKHGQSLKGGIWHGICCTLIQFNFYSRIFLSQIPTHTHSHLHERNQIAPGTHEKEVLLLCFQSSCQISGNISNQSLAFYVTRTLKSLIACSRGKKVENGKMEFIWSWSWEKRRGRRFIHIHETSSSFCLSLLCQVEWCPQVGLDSKQVLRVLELD